MAVLMNIKCYITYNDDRMMIWWTNIDNILLVFGHCITLLHNAAEKSIWIYKDCIWISFR